MLSEIEEIMGYDFKNLRNIPGGLLIKSLEAQQLVLQNLNWALATDIRQQDRDLDAEAQLISDYLDTALRGVSEIALKSRHAVRSCQFLNHDKTSSFVLYLYAFENFIGLRTRGERKTLSVNMSANLAFAISRLRENFPDQAIVYFRSIVSDIQNNWSEWEVGQAFFVSSTGDWQIPLDQLIKRASVIVVDGRHTTQSLQYELSRIAALGKKRQSLGSADPGISWPVS